MDGVSAVVYSVVCQESGIITSLVAAKSCLAKKSLTVTVAPHWLLSNGQCKQFIANRVGKIKKDGEIHRKCVPTEEKPADIASRGGAIVSGGTVQNGCQITNVGQKPPPATSEVEAKAIKKILAVAQANQTDDDTLNVFEDLLKRHDLRRTLRVQSWVLRFTTCRDRKGPLTSDDLRSVREWWIKHEQEKDFHKPHFEHTRKTLKVIARFIFQSIQNYQETCSAGTSRNSTRRRAVNYGRSARNILGTDTETTR